MPRAAPELWTVTASYADRCRGPTADARVRNRPRLPLLVRSVLRRAFRARLARAGAGLDRPMASCCAVRCPGESECKSECKSCCGTRAAGGLLFGAACRPAPEGSESGGLSGCHPRPWAPRGPGGGRNARGGARASHSADGKMTWRSADVKPWPCVRDPVDSKGCSVRTMYGRNSVNAPVVSHKGTSRPGSQEGHLCSPLRPPLTCPHRPAQARSSPRPSWIHSHFAAPDSLPRLSPPPSDPPAKQILLHLDESLEPANKFLIADRACCACPRTGTALILGFIPHAVDATHVVIKPERLEWVQKALASYVSTGGPTLLTFRAGGVLKRCSSPPSSHVFLYASILVYHSLSPVTRHSAARAKHLHQARRRLEEERARQEAGCGKRPHERRHGRMGRGRLCRRPIKSGGQSRRHGSARSLPPRP